MKFNFIFKPKKIRNHEASPAFVLTPELELYTAVATAALSDQFYEKASDKMERIISLIAKVNPVFVAKLAIYAREQMHLRSIPLVLTVELGKIQRGNSLVSKLTGRVVQRADEITELLAYYAIANGRKNVKQLNKLSKQLQKGLADAFNKFDEYQFAKYNRDTVVKLRDALFLVHPKAKDEAQQMLFNKIADKTLAVPYTWETELSALGQLQYDSMELKAQAVKAKWEELILSNKLGYMATLRNLRNMMKANIGNKAIQRVCEFLSDAKAVANSKQLPFRFLAAYRELQAVTEGRTGMLLTALENATLQSAANIKGFGADVKVVLAVDVSGSMQRPVGPNSKVLNYDIGLMLAMLLQTRCQNVITGMFGDKWKTIAVPKNNVLANVCEFYRREGEVGYATNGYLVIKDLLTRQKVADKVMLFTDCQLWSSNSNKQIAELWNEYKRLAPRARLYLFDLAGYGNTPLNVMRNDVFLIAGWSDKIFDVLNALENGGDALKLINAINLET